MRYKLLWLLGLTAVVIWAAVWVLPDNLLHVVFCNVGQGDATLISYRTTQILVDGGPDNSVLKCLDRHVPFYDRRIEVVMATHSEADHITGLVDVFKRYTVLYFVSNGIGNNTHIWSELVTNIERQKSQFRRVQAGEKLRLGNLQLRLAWPSQTFLSLHSDYSHQSVLGASTDGTKLNRFSLVGRLTFGEFDVLLPGDADAPVQDEQLKTGVISRVEVIKVPHHGSKTGMTGEWLDRLSPQLGVISVGKNNFGHPKQEILDMLRTKGVRILRTDKDGEIEVVSDGSKWWVKINK